MGIPQVCETGEWHRPKCATSQSYVFHVSDAISQEDFSSITGNNIV
jgi:hypothetical protein